MSEAINVARHGRSIIKFTSTLGGLGISLLLAACSGTGVVDGEGRDENTIPEPLGVTSAALVGGLHRVGALPDDPAKLAAKHLDMAPPTVPLPAVVDLAGDTPAPGNQGGQGSCVAWAVGYAAHSYLQHQEEGWPVEATHYQFSPSYIYNQINGGSDGGSRIGNAFDLLVNEGADTLRFSPYDDNDFTTQPDGPAKTRAAHFKLKDWVTLGTSSVAIKQQLAAGKPVVIGIQVLPDFDNLGPLNDTYNSSAGLSRGGHAVTIVGYDDARSAFRFMNSWGTGWGLAGYGWLDYSFITDAKLGLRSFVGTDAPNTAPAVGRNIYMIKGSQLWRIDRNFGNFVSLSAPTEWVGAGALTHHADKLYVVQGSRLWSVNPVDGKFATVGGANFEGMAHLATLGDSLYGIQNGRVWRINSTTGAAQQVGFQTWSTATSMTALDGMLYIIAHSKLYRFDPPTGGRFVLGGVSWAGPTLLTSSGGSLFAVQDKMLWSIDPATGAFARLGSDVWASSTSMSNLSGRLLIVDNKRLHSVVPSTGAWEVLNQPSWGGATLMTTIPR